MGEMVTLVEFLALKVTKLETSVPRRMKYSDGSYPGTELSGSSHSNVVAMNPGDKGRSCVVIVVFGALGTEEGAA